MAPTIDAALGGLGPQLVQDLSARDLQNPTNTQKVTLGVIAAYVVGIAILWNVPYLRMVLWPFKMLVIAFHEFGHASTAILTGGKVKSISLDPHEGGVTHLAGGISAITLPAGYLGSSFIGAVLTVCGFNINASKIVSLALGVCFLLTLWWGKRGLADHPDHPSRRRPPRRLLVHQPRRGPAFRRPLHRRHVLALQRLGHLRRPDPAQGQLVRRHRLR
jgi:hypothetical protein